MQPEEEIKTDAYPGISQQLVDRLFKHSESLLKERKDLKAPDSYPKKAEIIAKLGRKQQAQGVSESFNMSRVSHVDIEQKGDRLIVLGEDSNDKMAHIVYFNKKTNKVENKAVACKNSAE